MQYNTRIDTLFSSLKCIFVKQSSPQSANIQNTYFPSPVSLHNFGLKKIVDQQF
jgi:hypothetical protein